MKKYLKSIAWIIGLFLMFMLFPNLILADTIILREIIADNFVRIDDANSVFESAAEVATSAVAVTTKRAYLKVNLTNITNILGSNIVDNVSIYTFRGGNTDVGNINIHEVNGTFDPATLTWNNQPCGTGNPITNADKCNITIADTVLLDLPSIFWNMTITGMFKRALSEGRDELVFLYITDEDNQNVKINIVAKENTDGDKHWYLNITFTQVDTTPAEIILGNLTSEGGLGQIINLSNPFCHDADSVGCKVPKTNDTTPSFFFISNEDADGAIIDRNRNLNFTDITAGSSQCSTTGVQIHTCTLDAANATAVSGLHNFSVSLRNAAGLENLSATLFFLVNITDPTADFPTVKNVNITPDPLFDIDDATGQFTFFSPVGNPDQSGFQWFINDSEILTAVNTTLLGSNNLSFGSNITFCVNPYDGVFTGLQNCSVGSIVQVITTTDVFCGNISSMFFFPDVSNFNFSDFTLTQLKVVANGTSASLCLFNVTTDFPNNLNITFTLNQTFPKQTLFCNDEFNVTTSKIINASAVIGTTNSSSDLNAFCWADYIKANRSNDFDLTIDFVVT